jgi:hypothetical protein
MTILLDEVGPEELTGQEAQPTVTCGCCGELIRMSGKNLAVAMCQDCYARLMSEFLRAQHELSCAPFSSDR